MRVPSEPRALHEPRSLRSIGGLMPNSVRLHSALELLFQRLTPHSDVSLYTGRCWYTGVRGVQITALGAAGAEFRWKRQSRMTCASGSRDCSPRAGAGDTPPPQGPLTDRVAAHPSPSQPQAQSQMALKSHRQGRPGGGASVGSLRLEGSGGVRRRVHW